MSDSGERRGMSIDDALAAWLDGVPALPITHEDGEGKLERSSIVRPDMGRNVVEIVAKRSGTSSRFVVEESSVQEQLAQLVGRARRTGDADLIRRMKALAKIVEKRENTDAAVVRIRLDKSPNSQTPDRRATVLGLGLKHVGQCVVRKNTPDVRGQIKTVVDMVTVDFFKHFSDLPPEDRRDSACAAE